MVNPESDDIDGGEAAFAENPTADEDVPYIALFAGVAPEDVERVADEWRQLGTS